MGFFSKLFGKESRTEVSPVVIEEILSDSRGNELICAKCGFSFTSEQRIKTYDGKKFHLKPCWRKLRKEGISEYYNK